MAFHTRVQSTIAIVVAFLLFHCSHACLPREFLEQNPSYAPAPVTIERRSVSRPAVNQITIMNVRIFDGTQLSPLSTVLIDGDKIVYIHSDGCGGERWYKGAHFGVLVDGLGGTLLPGLFDSHTHPISIANLTTLSSWGITTALGMGCYPDAACNTLRNQVGLTDFYSPGAAATSPGSLHASLMHFAPSDLISSPDQAEQWVSQRVANGSNYIKMIAEAGGMTQAEHNALVFQAHNFSQQSMTHAADYPSYEQAIIAKTNGIQHSPIDKVVTADMVAAILQNKQFVTPTLTVMRAIASAAIALPSWSFYHASNSTAIMHKAGVPILAGTDSATIKFPGVMWPNYGPTLHAELENLVAAGLTPVETLNAATSVPAHYFGLTDRGVIQVGKRADLLLISGDPTTNISNTRNIQRVWNAGIEFTPVA